MLVNLTGQDLLSELGLDEEPQDEIRKVKNTFYSTHIINQHSVETLGKHKLDVRIAHRFGDIASPGAGWTTLYGLENAADILIGVEYGVLDNFDIGFNRTKGAGPLVQLLNGFTKYNVLKQTENGKVPLSITLMLGGTVSTMKKSADEFALSHFEKGSHRLMYVGQVMFAKKFGEAFSLQLTGSWVHRNIVEPNDVNSLFAGGLAFRLKLSRVFGIIVDSTVPFSHIRNPDNGYYFPLGIGLEIKTVGHVFHVNFTNAKAITETDYIPNTTSNWLDGEFRLGFTISRYFKLK